MNIIKGIYEPFTRLPKLIKHFGGLKNLFLEILYHDDAKIGRLVGQDHFGNRYYESHYYFYPKDRWVIYPNSVGFDYDASQIPPDWYGWLHHTTDCLPCFDPKKRFYSWMLPHTENRTGTSNAYYPYSTTKPKIHTWKPPRPKHIPCF